MDPNEPVAIYSTTSLAEAEVLQSVLEGEGIKCQLDGENQGSFAGVLDVKLLVRAADEEKARQVLDPHVTSTEDSANESGE